MTMVEAEFSSGMKLSTDDEVALKQSVQDLSDIDSVVLERLTGRFNYAYAVASRVVSGEFDPLTA